MEQICSQCHAVLGVASESDWCPACGGALVQRSPLAASANTSGVASPPAEVDHRGILLPHRHALGGIITPQ